MYVLIVTQENNCNLRSMCWYHICGPSLHRKHIDPVSIILDWQPFVRCKVCNKSDTSYLILLSPAIMIPCQDADGLQRLPQSHVIT